MPTKTQSARSEAGSGSATVGFRLEAESLHILVERAATLRVSPHALARRYLIEILSEGEERVALRHAINGLRQELAQTQESLALAVEALLSSAGKVSETNARAWVDKHFK